MDQVAEFYRIGLIEAVIFLFLFLLAFLSVTLIARDTWLRLGTTESLLARLGAGILLASIAVGGLSGVVLNLLQGTAFSDSTLSISASRTQAVLGIGIALALTVAGVVRIEIHQRSLMSPVVEKDGSWKVEEAEWKVEPPVGGRRLP
jgi:hypothetical protein